MLSNKSGTALNFHGGRTQPIPSKEALLADQPARSPLRPTFDHLELYPPAGKRHGSGLIKSILTNLIASMSSIDGRRNFIGLLKRLKVQVERRYRR